MKIKLLTDAAANVEGPWQRIEHAGHYMLAIEMTGNGTVKLRRRILAGETGWLVESSIGTAIALTASGEREIVLGPGMVRAEITAMTTGATQVTLLPVPPNAMFR